MGQGLWPILKLRKTFEEFINALQNDQCIDYNELIRYTDSELRRLCSKSLVSRIYRIYVN
jgi:hypothetical protein